MGIAGGGEGGTAGTLDRAAAEEALPNMAVEPRSYTSQEVNGVTPDQAHAATARGILAVPQMQLRLGGPPLSNKELHLRLLTAAPIGASAAAAAAEASAAAETKAAEEAKRRLQRPSGCGDRSG